MFFLSVIISSFNTKNILKKCLKLLKENFDYYSFFNYEIIVVDNGSNDGTDVFLIKLKKKWKNLLFFCLQNNVGFVRANNIGLKIAKGDYILFLNSDIFVNNLDFFDILNLMEKNKEIGALTVKVILENEKIDLASHRGFPNIWRSFTYFTGLERVFFQVPLLNRLFGGYHLSHLNFDQIHEIDCISGAFFLTRKKIIDKIGGFDEDYFSYGEDIELSWQIKRLGYKIIYYPLWKVIHLKSISGLKNYNKEIKLKTNYYFYEAMKIFYKKHYAKIYPFLLNSFVYFFIDFKRKLNELKIKNENNRN